MEDLPAVVWSPPPSQGIKDETVDPDKTGLSVQRLGKHVHGLLLDSGLVETVPRRRALIQLYKNCLTLRFLCSPCRI
jgi:hypothetical protein